MHPSIIIGIVRSLIVDVAMGQIPRSTERISSCKNKMVPFLSHKTERVSFQLGQAMGHRVMGQWVEWVTFLDGSPGSAVNVRSLMTHVCLFEHITYHTFMIMDETEQVEHFQISCVSLTNGLPICAGDFYRSEIIYCKNKLLRELLHVN